MVTESPDSGKTNAERTGEEAGYCFGALLVFIGVGLFAIRAVGYPLDWNLWTAILAGVAKFSLVLLFVWLGNRFMRRELIGYYRQLSLKKRNQALWLLSVGSLLAIVLNLFGVPAYEYYLTGETSTHTVGRVFGETIASLAAFLIIVCDLRYQWRKSREQT